MIEEHDFEMESFVRTAKGGVLILAKDIHNGKTYRLNFSRGDYEWLVGKRGIMSFLNQRPVGPFFLWCGIFMTGILCLVFRTNIIILGVGLFLSLLGAVFSAGTFWVCVTGKKSYGNVNDLV